MKILKNYEIEAVYLFFTFFTLYLYSEFNYFLFLTFLLIFLIIFNLKLNIKIQSICYFLSASFCLNFESFKHPLIYNHAFRQTQNAISARYMAQNSLSLFNPLPHIGVNTKAPFELPLLQILSASLQKAGVSEVYALRPLSWIIFVIFNITLFFYVISITQNTSLGNFLLIVFTFHPLFLKYSNAFMIEFIPHIFGILSLIFLQTDKKKYSTIFLSLSLLAKITTGIIYFFIFFLFDLNKIYKNSLKIRFNINLLFPYIISIFSISVWLILEENIKNSSKFSAWLKGSSMKNWNFGSIDKYSDLDSYIVILKRLLENFGILYPNYILGALVFLALILYEKKIGILLLVPIVFLNLYLVHDYYLLAIFPIAVFLIGLKLFKNNEKINIFILLFFIMLAHLNYQVSTRFDEYQNLNLMQSKLSLDNFETGLIQVLNEKEFQNHNNIYLAATFYDWNPTLFFYTNKYGIMAKDQIFKGNKEIEYFDFQNNDIEIFIFQDSDFDYLEFDLYREHIYKSEFDFIKIQKFEINSTLPELYSQNLKFFIATPQNNFDSNFKIFSTKKDAFDQEKRAFLEYLSE